MPSILVTKVTILLKIIDICTVARVREKYLEIEIFSRSVKIRGILWMAREI